MGDTKIAAIPYEERTDEQKLHSNWKKATGLFERSDWSASVMRVATSAEIAANIYIRQFLLVDYALPATVVDALLMGANGLEGKFKRLIKPVADHRGTWHELKGLRKQIESLNGHRNDVAHAGHFKNEEDAKLAFSDSLAIVQSLAPRESSTLALPYAP